MDGVESFDADSLQDPAWLRPRTFTYEGFLEELLHRYLQEHRFSRN